MSDLVPFSQTDINIFQQAGGATSYGTGGYATRLDGNTFVAASSPVTAATTNRPVSGAGGSTFKAPQARMGTAGGAKGAGGKKVRGSIVYCSKYRLREFSGSYTGYDAAVYAAATSYLQSKASGAGSQWLGLKKGGAGAGGGGGGGGMTGGGHTGFAGAPSGRGSFPKKTGGGGGPRGVQQLHYCDVCKISCAGPQVGGATL